MSKRARPAEERKTDEVACRSTSEAPLETKRVTAAQLGALLHKLPPDCLVDVTNLRFTLKVCNREGRVPQLTLATSPRETSSLPADIVTAAPVAAASVAGKSLASARAADADIDAFAYAASTEGRLHVEATIKRCARETALAVAAHMLREDAALAKFTQRICTYVGANGHKVYYPYWSYVNSAGCVGEIQKPAQPFCLVRIEDAVPSGAHVARRYRDRSCSGAWVSHSMCSMFQALYFERSSESDNIERIRAKQRTQFEQRAAAERSAGKEPGVLVEHVPYVGERLYQSDEKPPLVCGGMVKSFSEVPCTWTSDVPEQPGLKLRFVALTDSDLARVLALVA